MFLTPKQVWYNFHNRSRYWHPAVTSQGLVRMSASPSTSHAASPPHQATLLLVEDDRALREVLAYNLEQAGYRVRTVSDGQEGLQAARAPDVALVVLDIMLPSMDGLEITRRLRMEGNMVPILILTARDSEIDRVLGLELGADDYLTKPFSMREFLARVKALLRRSALSQEDTTPPAQRLTFGNLVIDLLRHEVTLNGRPLSLKPKEFDLLLFLARHRGQVLSRALILERVWGWQFEGGTRTVDVHIRWLREKLEPDPSHPTRIVTVRGVGYRFEG